jgi:hypothetical protein
MFQICKVFFCLVGVFFCLIFFFFFGSIRVWTQGLTLARQALYHLKHSASPPDLKKP